MYTKHKASVMCETECNTCKLSYAPLLSGLIIFCKSLCDLNGNSLCVIKNDTFHRQMCCTLNKR